MWESLSLRTRLLLPLGLMFGAALLLGTVSLQIFAPTQLLEENAASCTRGGGGRGGAQRRAADIRQSASNAGCVRAIARDIRGHPIPARRRGDRGAFAARRAYAAGSGARLVRPSSHDTRGRGELPGDDRGQAGRRHRLCARPVRRHLREVDRLSGDRRLRHRLDAADRRHRPFHRPLGARSPAKSG